MQNLKYQQNGRNDKTNNENRDIHPRMYHMWDTLVQDRTTHGGARIWKRLDKI